VHFGELVNNAIKFTSYGQVLVDVRLQKTEGEKFFINFNIIDSGIGIAPEKIKTMFTVFSQADMSTTRKYGGTGLGLSICKELVELMKGEIGIDSENGKGSNFHFTIPMAKSESEMGEDYQTQRQEIVGRKITLVENNAIGAKILEKNLAELQLQCQTIKALTGADNIERNSDFILSELEKCTDISAIMISHNSHSGINAVDIAEKIKTSSKLKTIPLILLVSAQEKIKISSEKLSLFNRAITKPIKKTRLLMALFFIFKITYYEEEGTLIKQGVAEDENLGGKGLKLLLCEDNEVNVKVALMILKRLGLKPDVAENGQEAVNKFMHVAYDLILMDCMMPVMDGFMATQKIREIEKEREVLKPVVIIALTANAGEEDRKKCLNSSMNDFLAKPIRREEISEALERNLKIKITPPAPDDHNTPAK
jgi:CheY-like chemotaxis protein